jgi:hypothetical protein
LTENFQTIKQRALITQLKQEVEELKYNATTPDPPPKRFLNKHLPAHPYPIEWSTFAQTPELIIDLTSSSPTNAPLARSVPDLQRKRPRAPDENQYRTTSDAALLPPPKVRVGGLPKPRDEIMERVSVRSNGEIQRWATNVARPAKGPGNMTRPMAQFKAPKRTPEPQLSLGKGGKLVAAVKKRKVSAV